MTESERIAVWKVIERAMRVEQDSLRAIGQPLKKGYTWQRRLLMVGAEGVKRINALDRKIHEEYSSRGRWGEIPEELHEQTKPWNNIPAARLPALVQAEEEVYQDMKRAGARSRHARRRLQHQEKWLRAQCRDLATTGQS